MTAMALTVPIAFGLAVAGPAMAQWAGPGWDRQSGDSFGSRGGYGHRYDRGGPDRSGAARSGEGRVSVSRFVGQGQAAAALGHGAITVSSQSSGPGYLSAPDRGVFEAALVDGLVKAGYDTTAAHPEGGQVAEIAVTRIVLVPAEPPHKPVSGEASFGVSNRGSGYGLALGVDLTKPLPALLSTRMTARIRDRVSGVALWEGRADIVTREGDAKWNDPAIAAKLAGALLDGFPRTSDGIATARE